jgi:hypothetical protein
VNFWTAIVVMVAIIAFTNMRMAKYRGGARESLRDEVRGMRRLRGHHGDAMDALPQSPREADLEREVADLKKRLAVLERIATDERQSRSIAQEIESLRDR